MANNFNKSFGKIVVFVGMFFLVTIGTFLLTSFQKGRLEKIEAFPQEKASPVSFSEPKKKLKEVSDSTAKKETKRKIEMEKKTEETKKISVKTPEKSFYVKIATPVLRIRSAPTVKSRVVRLVKKGMIFEIEKEIREGENVWYKIKQPKYLRYPERITSDWFIAAKHTKHGGEKLVERVKEKEIYSFFPDTEPQDKWIKVDLSEQFLQAFEKDKLVFSTYISSGLNLPGYRNQPGDYRIVKKVLSTYMQGPLPGDRYKDYFDLPGIPYNMFFTWRGHALHGTYWHNNFGHRHSHGCINLTIEDAEKLYWWAPVGTLVRIVE
ncbi:L,D-transpeptidase family protein [bacterium]|nr:L,D-transpeptidase family protein [bacterium]